MVHGFYAAMGGFAFETSFTGEEPDVFGTGHPRLTITSRGIALLAKCGRLPIIQREDIVDKSKSDGIAKSVACLQAGWMIVQILGRVALDLPVTLLEINTLGHIICAFFIYVLWWHKPQTILEPTKLTGAWIKPLCAYMYMCSKISGSDDHQIDLTAKRLIKPELSDLVLLQPSELSINIDKFSCANPRNLKICLLSELFLGTWMKMKLYLRLIATAIKKVLLLRKCQTR